MPRQTRIGERCTMALQPHDARWNLVRGEAAGVPKGERREQPNWMRAPARAKALER
jgi:hypothetical protein